jgi:hypothetical protein
MIRCLRTGLPIQPGTECTCKRCVASVETSYADAADVLGPFIVDVTIWTHPAPLAGDTPNIP